MRQRVLAGCVDGTTQGPLIGNEMRQHRRRFGQTIAMQACKRAPVGVEALNVHVQGVLKAAVARAKANKRGTVRPQDL